MAQQSFSGSIDAWVQKTKARQLAVFQTAAQHMFEEVLSRTPRDTGFLANTLEASLDAPQMIRPTEQSTPNSRPSARAKTRPPPCSLARRSAMPGR